MARRCSSLITTKAINGFWGRLGDENSPAVMCGPVAEWAKALLQIRRTPVQTPGTPTFFHGGYSAGNATECGVMNKERSVVCPYPPPPLPLVPAYCSALTAPIETVSGVHLYLGHSSRGGTINICPAVPFIHANPSRNFIRVIS